MSKKGLFVGLCGLDVVFYEDKPLPVEDVKMKCSDLRACIGGPAANAAITYALLGGNATVVSYIGNSSVGKVIKQMMADYGIKVVDLCLDEDVKCISSIYVNTTNATRTIFSGRNEIHELDAFSALEKEIEECDFILYDGHFSHIDQVLLEGSKRLNKDIVIDVGGWKDTFNDILKYNPTLICSEVFNRDGLNGVALQDVFGYERVAITRGGRNIIYKTKDMAAQAEVEVKSVKAIDTLGAGDVFHGAYCYFKYERDLDFKSALAEAMNVATASTTVYGVVGGVNEYISTYNHKN